MDPKSGSTLVTPCESSSKPATGSYLVFERLPSYASPKASSTFWPSNPQLMQFKQMYTTSPVTTLLSGGNTTQYYTCGS